MSVNLQANASPYAWDNLDGHDAGLSFAIEFGTNIVPNTPGAAGIGDPWDPGAVGVAPASVQARLATLQVFADGDAGANVPRGQTYAIPPWPVSTPPQKFLMRVIYARLRRFRPSDDSGGGAANTAELFFGPAGMSALAYDGGAMSVGIEGGGTGGPFLLESVAVVREWLAGACAAGTPGNATRMTLGNDVLLCFGLLLEDPGGPKPETEVVIWACRPGAVAWEFLGFGEVEGTLERFGLAACGVCKAQLDWLRVYEWSPQDFAAIEGDTLEDYPPTGARLFGGAI